MKHHFLYFGYKAMTFHLKSFLSIFINALLISAVFILAEEEKKVTVSADSALNKNNNHISKQDSGFTSIDSTSDTAVSSLMTAAPASDTIALIRGVSDSVTDTADSSIRAGESDIDTSYRIWKHPFWGFGIGWELGSMPVFDLWKEGTENEIALKTLLLDFLVADSIVSVTILERPTPYNVCFPLSIAYTPFISKRHLLSFNLTFSWIRKNSRTEFVLDSLSTANLEQSLSLKSFYIGLKFHFLIPLPYFNIDKFDASYVTIGLSGSPLLILREWTEADNKHEDKKNSFGIGIKWYAGITTLRRVSQKGGVEVGITYTGSWNGRFMHDGHHIKRGDINLLDSHYSDVLEYVSHRFIIYFNILAGKKSYLKII